MLPDPPCISKDTYGCDVFVVRTEHLQDFPAFIEWIRKNGYGRDSGILKLRLHEEDKQDDSSMLQIMDLLNARFPEKKSRCRTGKKQFVYSPVAQIFFKASVEDDIYQFCSTPCTSEERATFVKSAANPLTYRSSLSNCCSEVLKSEGLDGIRKHLFEKIGEGAPYTSSLIQKEKGKERYLGIQCEDFNVNIPQQTPIIYGAGINITDPIAITSNFSLSELGTIIDNLDEKFDGITYPYLYCGTTHSSFPWHIEDGGMFSINYVSAGSPKIWFGFAPKFFGLVDNIAQTFSLEKDHTGCRAFLVDHKTLVADPLYFKKHHGIPYTVLVQEPGEFIITLPYALHSGFNLGSNLAMAANFGDSLWLEEAIHAPVCNCYENQQVQLQLLPLLRAFRPDLIPTYNATGSTIPEDHPRQVKRICSRAASGSLDKDVSSALENVPLALRLVSKKVLKSKRWKPTLYCPECSQSYKGNKISRLTKHIQKVHSEKKDQILKTVNIRYPKWKPKLTNGHTCRICGRFRRGSLTHLKQHHEKLHPSLPFLGALK